LPAALIAACRRRNIPFFVLALAGQADVVVLKGVPHAWCRLGQTTRAIRILQSQGADAVVMAGSVRRPWLPGLRPDWRTIKVLVRLGFKCFGDDALLRTVAAEFEKEGLRVVGAHEIEPALLTPEGALGARQPTPAHMNDITAGFKAARELGARDIGQAVVMRQGRVAGFENARGTDALLKRCKGEGGVLIKAAKPQQDCRFDLPSIGPATVIRAHESGLEGIAVEAGASLTLDRAVLAETADRLGLFVVGVKPA